ncbi:MAG: hypothetical protein Q7S79_03535 [bacterium]|nr:hypothetical protein [bacterium]
MANKQSLRPEGLKQGVNPAAAGLVGAIIGVAAGAAAVALSDEKNRKKLGKTVKNLTAEGTKTVNELKGTINEWRDSAEEKVEDAKTQLEEAKSDKK